MSMPDNIVLTTLSISTIFSVVLHGQVFYLVVLPSILVETGLKKHYWFYLALV